MSCGVGHIHGFDPVLLWLWCRLAAVGPIRPLAWEFPYATGVALKSKNKINKSINKISSMQKNMYIYILFYSSKNASKIPHIILTIKRENG